MPKQNRKRSNDDVINSEQRNKKRRSGWLSDLKYALRSSPEISISQEEHSVANETERLSVENTSGRKISPTKSNRNEKIGLLITKKPKRPSGVSKYLLKTYCNVKSDYPTSINNQQYECNNKHILYTLRSRSIHSNLNEKSDMNVTDETTNTVKNTPEVSRENNKKCKDSHIITNNIIKTAKLFKRKTDDSNENNNYLPCEFQKHQYKVCPFDFHATNDVLEEKNVNQIIMINNEISLDKQINHSSNDDGCEIEKVHDKNGITNLTDDIDEEINDILQHASDDILEEMEIDIFQIPSSNTKPLNRELNESTICDENTMSKFEHNSPLFEGNDEYSSSNAVTGTNYNSSDNILNDELNSSALNDRALNIQENIDSNCSIYNFPKYTDNNEESIDNYTDCNTHIESYARTKEGNSNTSESNVVDESQPDTNEEIFYFGRGSPENDNLVASYPFAQQFNTALENGILNLNNNYLSSENINNAEHSNARAYLQKNEAYIDKSALENSNRNSTWGIFKMFSRKHDGSGDH